MNLRRAASNEYRAAFRKEPDGKIWIYSILTGRCCAQHDDEGEWWREVPLDAAKLKKDWEPCTGAMLGWINVSQQEKRRVTGSDGSPVQPEITRRL